MTARSTELMEVAEAAAAAALAAPVYGRWSDERRRDLLHTAAAALLERGDDIIAVLREETGLTEARLRGELTRTVDQLRTLGDFVAAGHHRDNRVSPGAAGGADVRAVAVPVGPVAVFAASNFPLAFGVAGGDTGSALAAGCPVVIKAHPAQPRGSHLIAAALQTAIVTVGAPAGTVGFIASGDPAVSIALVQAPPIRAVGFTGSLNGGRALMAAAAARPDPIAVYAEMGSLNPVFVLPGAAAVASWPDTLAASVTGSAGQLCTKPGLVLCPDTPDGRAFADALATAVAASPTQPMLTEAMAAAHRRWRDDAAARPDATVIGGPQDGGGSDDDASRLGRPFAVRVSADDLTGPVLAEHFGPTVTIAVADVAHYPAIAARLDGALTATMLGEADDEAIAAELLPALTATAGRVIWNGVPTGVAVCDAMVHGGPWPATSASASTSVGNASILRFLRPVAFQGFPDRFLPTVAPKPDVRQ